MKRLFIVSLLSAALLVGLFPGVGSAASTTNKGLFLSPPRNFIDVDAGKTAQGEMTLANFTESPLDIALSIKEFTVADYSYDYVFRDVTENWVHFSQSSVRLEPAKNQKISYTVTPPAQTAPGGKYYTIVASATIKRGSVPAEVQVAAPLYITVKGTAIQTSKLASHSLPSIVIGDHVPFSLDITNTGNIHYTTTVTGSLSGPWTDKSTITATHILLPGTTRRITESIPMPLLPGVYKASYGYGTDTSKPIMIEGFVVYTPLWFYAVMLFIVWVAYILMRRRKSKHTPMPTATDSRQ